MIPGDHINATSNEKVGILCHLNGRNFWEHSITSVDILAKNVWPGSNHDKTLRNPERKTFIFTKYLISDLQKCGCQKAKKDSATNAGWIRSGETQQLRTIYNTRLDLWS